MTCENCTAAQTNPLHGRLTATCRGCRVRTVARGPQFAASQAAGRVLPDYAAMMSRMFGEGWRSVHEEVKTESLRLASLLRAWEGAR